jgi:hypothetical protein
MTDSDNLSQEIDELFEHLTSELQHGLNDALLWSYSVRAADVAQLEAISRLIGSEFQFHIQSQVRMVDLDTDTETPGEPMLQIEQVAVMSPEQVKLQAEAFQRLAEENGARFDGVTCHEPDEMDEYVGWLDVEDAEWRLRYFTDCGLDAGTELPWVFLIVTPDAAAVQPLADGLKASGCGHLKVYDEPDDEGMYGIYVFVEGTNDASALADAFATIESTVNPLGGQLEGVQFFTEDEMESIDSDTSDFDDEEFDDEEFSDDLDEDDQLDDDSELDDDDDHDDDDRN